METSGGAVERVHDKVDDVVSFAVVCDEVHVLGWTTRLSASPWRSSIADLHNVLQLSMGWTDAHLNRFLIHGKDFGVSHVGGTLVGYPSRVAFW